MVFDGVERRRNCLGVVASHVLFSDTKRSDRHVTVIDNRAGMSKDSMRVLMEEAGSTFTRSSRLQWPIPVRAYGYRRRAARIADKDLAVINHVAYLERRFMAEQKHWVRLMDRW